jgi:hypothetical protein
MRSAYVDNFPFVIGGRGMVKDKGTIGAEPSEKVVNAFEAGIVFGRMVENRRPRRSPLWSEDEWRQALIKAVGKKSELAKALAGYLNGASPVTRAGPR